MAAHLLTGATSGIGEHLARALHERGDDVAAELAGSTCEQLRAILPGFATASNPLDLTAALMGNGGLFPKVLDALGSDPDADMFLVGIPVAGPGYDVPALADATAAFARRLQRPVAGVAARQVR